MSIWGRIRIFRSVVRGLREEDLGPDPVAGFNRWLKEARAAGTHLAEAVALATAGAEGEPTVRMMLLKGADEKGFRFYTNYNSRKAGALEENPRAAMVFHWNRLERQVRVEGRVERLSREESNAYFQTRPRGSRIGAWASDQSSVLAGRDVLEKAVAEYRARFKGGEVPLPPFWGGYILRPERIEFWQGRVNRLHDRLSYTREGEGWRIERLAP